MALAGILIHLVLRFVAGAPPSLSLLPLYAVVVLGGLPLLVTLGRKLVVLDFGSDLLAGHLRSPRRSSWVNISSHAS